jgi:hypothetical protein
MLQSGAGGYSEGSDGAVGGSQDDEPIRNPDGGKGGPGQGWPNPKRSTPCSLLSAPGPECVRPISAREHHVRQDRR